MPTYMQMTSKEKRSAATSNELELQATMLFTYDWVAKESRRVATNEIQ